MNTSSFTRFIPRPAAPSLLRNVALRLLRRVNPGDIAIRHHYTNEPFTLHSFKHRGYWYFGKRREYETMSLFPRVIADGDFVVEIGGHIGYMSVYFAALVGSQGRVVVFEPGPNNLPYLRANVRRRENVRVVEQAVTDFTGAATLHTEELSGQNNSLLEQYSVVEANLRAIEIGAIGRAAVTVPCTTFDAFLESTPGSTPSFVKIDVEGAELSVLRGMRKWLEQDVGLMIEVTENRDAVYALMRDSGFRMFTDGRAAIDSAAEVPLNIFCFKAGGRRIQAMA